MQAVVAALLLAGTVAMIVGLSRRPLSRSQLAIQAGELRSSASELVLFAEEQRAGHLTGAFAQVHGQSLLDAVTETKQSLDEAKPEPGLEGWLERARQRAGDIEKLAQQVQQDVTGGSGPLAVDSPADELRRESAALQELEEALKH